MITKLEIILIVVFVTVVLSICYLVYFSPNKRWKCIEGKCEKSINGGYVTKEECLNLCNKKKYIKE